MDEPRIKPATLSIKIYGPANTFLLCIASFKRPCRRIQWGERPVLARVFIYIYTLRAAMSQASNNQNMMCRFILCFAWSFQFYIKEIDLIINYDSHWKSFTLPCRKFWQLAISYYTIHDWYTCTLTAIETHINHHK